MDDEYQSAGTQLFCHRQLHQHDNKPDHLHDSRHLAGKINGNEPDYGKFNGSAINAAASLLSARATMSKQYHTHIRLRQSGGGLIELLIAVLIGLFITLGLSQVFLNMWSASLSQNSLAQFQDNERLALFMLSNTIQQAGYYANPVTSTAATALPATTSAGGDLATIAAGIGISGTTGTTNDTIDVSFQTSGSDGLMNCQGKTAATATVFVNSFSINNSNQLVCSLDGGTTFLTLATNVASMKILYGVDSQGLGTTDCYLSASSMTTALWALARTVQITITFTNPIYSSQTRPWVQTINLMRLS